MLSSFFLEQAAALLDTKTKLDFASELWLGELPKQIDIRASDVSYISGRTYQKVSVDL